MSTFKSSLFAISMLTGSAASALTMTFDRSSYNADGDYYEEAGIRVTGNGEHEGVGHAILIESLTAISSAITIKTGGLFDAQSFDITSAGTNFFTFVGDHTGSGGPAIPFEEYNIHYEDVRVQGIKDNVVVAEELFSAQDASTYSFNNSFSGLDTLKIWAYRPSDTLVAEAYAELLAMYPDFSVEIGCGYKIVDFIVHDSCTSFGIDNISLTKVTPVPLPASFPLFVGGLGLVAWLRKRRKISSAE